MSTPKRTTATQKTELSDMPQTCLYSTSHNYFTSQCKKGLPGDSLVSYQSTMIIFSSYDNTKMTQTWGQYMSQYLCCWLQEPTQKSSTTKTTGNQRSQELLCCWYRLPMLSILYTVNDFDMFYCLFCFVLGVKTYLRPTK